jgi:hypothetical protein
VDNFCRVHKTLRVTPAMEAGIADHLWSLEELIGLISDKMENAAFLGGVLIRLALWVSKAYV